LGDQHNFGQQLKIEPKFKVFDFDSQIEISIKLSPSSIFCSEASLCSPLGAIEKHFSLNLRMQKQELGGVTTSDFCKFSYRDGEPPQIPFGGVPTHEIN
jgi:hypothetical protein